LDGEYRHGASDKHETKCKSDDELLHGDLLGSAGVAVGQSWLWLDGERRHGAGGEDETKCKSNDELLHGDLLGG
jgi:hypothetical protein